MSTARKPNSTKPTAKPAAEVEIADDEVFDLDVVEAESTFAPFPFRLGGRVFALPHMRKLDRKMLLAADGGDVEAMNAAFRVGLGDDFAAFDKLPLSLNGLNELFRRWLAHSGLAEGE
ncbi:hypothetical protein SMC26_40295 [Actinomadura fulvescens]|uniref:Tail assembly chaperone n=1 Tax=Actinomadura fulvescens TaxID=46160 RepID=A0ABN3Q6Y9_9ACTN